MATCPHAQLDATAPCTADERKSAAVAAQAERGARSFTFVRDLNGVRATLRDPAMRQAGFLARLVSIFGGKQLPVLYLSGPAHRRQRSATARFFAPRVVATRYRDLMEATAAELIARLRRDGQGSLDELGMEMAVAVAAEVVGLTDSDRQGMARRLEGLATGIPADAPLPRLIGRFVIAQYRASRFMKQDVQPAIRARQAQRREDVISHLIDEGYSDPAILTECLTYGVAGIVTTCEFIAMAAWHLVEQPGLRARFMAADEVAKLAILEEILRLEPVVGTLYRRPEGAAKDAPTLALDIRGANTDPVIGACPYRLDPDRPQAPGTSASGFSFGDGEHRCPGAQVALHESAVFLTRLFEVPGLRLKRAPDVGWNSLVAGYELRGMMVTCDQA